MLFLNVFKVTIWNSFILSIDFFFFLAQLIGLVSLKLNILFV